MSKLSKSQQWFVDNVAENEKELKEIGELANCMLNDKISLLIQNGMTTIAIYCTIFDTICKELKSFEADYDEFDINIANRLHVGFTNITDENDEKVGNFMVYLQSETANTMSDDNIDDSEPDTIVLCTEWNATNVQCQTDIIKRIATNGAKALGDLLNLKTESVEYVIPTFCIIHSALVKYITLKRAELNLDEYEINVAGLFSAGIKLEADDTTAEEVVYFTPSISLKRFFKDDSTASAKYD